MIFILQYRAIVFRKRIRVKENNKIENFDDLVLGLPSVDNYGKMVNFKPLSMEDSMLHMVKNEESDSNIIKFEK